MTENTAKFVGNIPENYDRGLGPNIFIDYAQDIAKRVGDFQPDNVLELAAGTGILSRELRDTLPESTDLLISDLNPPMLDIARLKFGKGENVSFQQINAMETGCPDSHFDMVVCQFGTMFFPGKVEAFAETSRILKPGGAHVFNTWGTMEDNPFSQIAHNTSASFFPDNAPPEFYHVPFSYANSNEVTSDMQKSGFTDISHVALNIDKTITSFSSFAYSLVHGNPLIDEIRNLENVTEDNVVSKMEANLRQAFPTGTMPLLAHVFVGRKS